MGSLIPLDIYSSDRLRFRNTFLPRNAPISIILRVVCNMMINLSRILHEWSQMVTESYVW